MPAAAAAASLPLSHTYSQRASRADRRYSGLVELEKVSSSGGSRGLEPAEAEAAAEAARPPAASCSAALSSMVLPLPGGPQRMKGILLASH
jgi:hypothetical protein